MDELEMLIERAQRHQRNLYEGNELAGNEALQTVWEAIELIAEHVKRLERNHNTVE